MPAEPEGVAQCHLDGPLLRLVEREVQFRIELRIQIVEIDGRRNDIVLHRQRAGNRLHGSGSSQQVTCHGFRGTDIQFVRMFAEHFQNSGRFGDVAQARRGTVYLM